MKNLIYLKNKTKFDLSAVTTDLIAVFTTKPGSKLETTQMEYKKVLESQLLEHGITVFFVTTEEEFSESECFLCDNGRELIDMCSIHKGKRTIDESLIIYKKEGDSLKVLSFREKPEPKYNWIQATLQCAINYYDTKPYQGNLWKYGQIVQESGEYMCTDCGYIMTLNTGDMFPACEVCQSGDPAGPVGPEIGFWEKI